MSNENKLPSVITDLKPADCNPRIITPEALDGLKSSVAEFGDIGGIVFNVRLGCLVAGHQRVAALREKFGDGLTIQPDGFGNGRIDTAAGPFGVRFVDWDDTRTRAAMLVANNPEIQGDWTDAAADMLDRLHEEAGDMFAAMKFDRLLVDLRKCGAGQTDEADAEPQINRADELNAKWNVVLGDLWQIGRHRLLCGDSTEPDAVSRVLSDEKPILMVTDPPYGVNYDPAWRADAGVNHNTKKLGTVENDDRADWTTAWDLFPSDVAYVWHAGLKAAVVEASLTRSRFLLRSQIVWVKDRFALSRGDYHWQHEPCLYAVRKNATGHWAGDRSQATVWSIPARDDDGHGHGTQKPLECMARAIRNHYGDVYEPFAGSGTTLVAAENLGRTCYAIELNPPYCAVILDRMKTAFPNLEIKRVYNH